MVPFVIVVSMKSANKLMVRIVMAVVIGFLLAGVGTKITYTCVPHPGEEGCVSFEKAIMHPSDLLDNKQDSLVQFSKTFAITSLASFVLLSVIGLTQKRKFRPASQPRG